jgi:hypothetical protein
MAVKEEENEQPAYRQEIHDGEVDSRDIAVACLARTPTVRWLFFVRIPCIPYSFWRWTENGLRYMHKQKHCTIE